MTLFNSSHAKNVARNIWDLKDIELIQTNRPKAYYFSADLGGGYVIHEDALSNEEISVLEKFTSALVIEIATWSEGGKSKSRLSHKFSAYRKARPVNAAVSSEKVFFLSDAAEWSLAVARLGIIRADKTNDIEPYRREAEAIFLSAFNSI